MQTKTTTRISNIVIMTIVAVALAAACLCLAARPAWAETSAEKQAQADALMTQVDALQTQLNAANADYDAATSDHSAAVAAMNEAQGRIDSAESQIERLQERLSKRAVGMYKSGGNTSFLNVILGSTTFDEFLTQWDALETITTQDAEMVQETKDLRAEAQSAHDEYATQEKTASDAMQKAADSKNQITATTASLQAQIATISAEAQQLAAEEAAAEEAAVAAAQAAAMSSGSYTDSDATAGNSVISGSGILAHPCPGATISSTFGPRWGTTHKGIDFSASTGTPYYAADSGTVLYATNDGGYNGGAGNWVVLVHGNGMVTKYMHSSAVFVSPGEYVERGQNIGQVGNTGDSTGPHLHFQVEVNGVAVDPTNYL